MNGYPDQNDQNPERNEQGLEKILNQGGNKLLGKKWPKGDITSNKRDGKGQTDNGSNRPKLDYSHLCKGIKGF